MIVFFFILNSLLKVYFQSRLGKGLLQNIEQTECQHLSLQAAAAGDAVQSIL